MTEDIRNKYKMDICEDCNGHGYVSFRSGADGNCDACDGEGAIYTERIKEGD